MGPFRWGSLKKKKEREITHQQNECKVKQAIIIGKATARAEEGVCISVDATCQGVWVKGLKKRFDG